MDLHKLELPSNKKFGLFFSAIFLCISIYMYTQTKYTLCVFFVCLFCLFSLCSLTKPKLLEPLNFWWMMLGLLLSKIANPLLLGVIFFVIITPTAIVAKLFGRDELQIKSRMQDSFWKKRNFQKTSNTNFENQF